MKNILHLDADESAFFKRQLEYIKARTYDVKYKELKAFSLIPISAEAPNGATEITWRSFKQYGLARIIADYAHDFPRVDVFGTEQTVKVKDIGDSYGYSIPEIRRAAMAGFDLEGRRAATARRAMDEKLHDIALNGDATYNLQGFIDYPGVNEYVVPNGTDGTPQWSTKTADEILTDLNGIVTTIVEVTSGRERPNTIIMPIGQYNLIRNTRLGTNSDITVYEFFAKNNPDITIDWLNELDGAGDEDSDLNATDRMIAYTRDEEHLTLEIPTAFEQLEEEKTGMEYTIPCHASCAGTIVYYPLSVAVADGI
jgi:hypothetical protein